MAVRTRYNKIISWWPGGGTDPAQRFITPRLITDGWIPEIDLHLNDCDGTFGHDETWVSFPFGVITLETTDFCGLLACTGPLARVADIGEFQQAFGRYYKELRVRINFYLGNPPSDVTLAPLFATDRAAWFARVNAAIAPIALLHAQGVPVGFGLDAVADGFGADQSLIVAEYLRNFGPVWVEPRPLRDGGEPFNTARYGTITIDSQYSDDYIRPDRYIPAADLKARKMLLCLQNPPGQPGSYSQYIRKVGTLTGADIGLISNRNAVRSLTADAFRVRVPL